MSALTIYQTLARLNEDADWQWPVIYQMGLCFERLRLSSRAAEAYRKGQAGALLTTGGVYLHLYAQDGTPLALTRPDHRLPPERLRRAGPTPEVLWEEGFAAALVATPLGLLVLTAETSPIEAALEALREALLRAFLLLFPLGLALVYLTARLAARPLEAVAREITRRSPDRLDPVPHRLPKDEFGRMVEAVNALLQALKEAKERERAFLAEASHELRTPLTVLLGHLDRLGRNPMDLEALRTARATAERMRRLVEDLSLVSRVEAKAVEIRPRPLDPKGLLEEALARFQSAFQAKGVALSLEAQDPLPQVWADEERVLQVLANLLTNALRHTPQGGEVRLRAFRQGEAVAFQVADTGPGIPEEHLPHIFERFYRVDKARDRERGGSGLGLAIVKAILEAHGGEVWVESQVGKGTAFSFSLPASGPPPPPR